MGESGGGLIRRVAFSVPSSARVLRLMHCELLAINFLNDSPFGTLLQVLPRTHVYADGFGGGL